MIIKINAYELESENIVDYYPCNVLGERQEQGIWTFIEEKDGFKGIYLLNASKLSEKLQEIEKGGAE